MSPEKNSSHTRMGHIATDDAACSRAVASGLGDREITEFAAPIARPVVHSEDEWRYKYIRDMTTVRDAAVSFLSRARRA